MILDRLPALDGKLVLDLGCGIGDVAAELVARGAGVIGFDINEELLREARSKRLRGAEFRLADIRRHVSIEQTDGIWCSFTAAYLPDLQTNLLSWRESLNPGGWVALIEIDDLFGHEPLSDAAKAALNGYSDESLAVGRYDFRMGRKIRHYLKNADFSISEMFTVEDSELSFKGPASPEVLSAWRRRFERMELLRKYCGPDFPAVQDEFLGCLMSPDHVSVATVQCCIARK